MNFQQLVLKNRGKHLRVRPVPAIDANGRLTEIRKEQNLWTVTPSVDRKVEVRNSWFSSSRILSGDSILGFREPDFLHLKCLLIFRGAALDIEPLPAPYWGYPNLKPESK